jgi:hypothetical protein
MKTIDFTVTIDRPIEQAQSQIVDGVGSRLRSASLSQRITGNQVEYRPKFVGLFFLWLARRLSGEGVTFTFEEQGGSSEVRVAGKLRDRAYSEVTEAFGGV